MKRLTSLLLLGMAMAWPLVAQAGAASDQEVRQQMIAESIAAYSGICPCPYSINRAGRKCGTWSAWSKPGGAEPLCYEKDISDEMVKGYGERRY